MDFTSISGLQRDGFQSFLTVAQLRQLACGQVPDLPGVYLVVWPNKAPPTFWAPLSLTKLSRLLNLLQHI
jgi:hypothetical protein